MRPASRRSVCTAPGTVAGTRAPSTSAGTPPPVERRVQSRCSGVVVLIESPRRDDAVWLAPPHPLRPPRWEARMFVIRSDITRPVPWSRSGPAALRNGRVIHSRDRTSAVHRMQADGPLRAVRSYHRPEAGGGAGQRPPRLVGIWPCRPPAATRLRVALCVAGRRVRRPAVIAAHQDGATDRRYAGIRPAAWSSPRRRGVTDVDTTAGHGDLADRQH